MGKRYIKIIRILFLIVFILVSSISNAQQIELWRYDLEKAIRYILMDDEVNKLSTLTKELKSSNIQESVWNVIRWEENNISYDWDKAKLPNPLLSIWDNGRVEIIRGRDRVFQTPYETIQKGKGVCSDYALLTLGLLYSMGYMPIYVLDIGFKNDSTRHTGIGMMINGWLFILDQQLPVMDSGTYYKHWINTEGAFISDISLYQINREGGLIINKMFIDIEDFKKVDYNISDRDLEVIASWMMKSLQENLPHLKVDPRLSFLEKGTSLPKGYSKGKIHIIEFPNFADYYNPIFHNQFVNYFCESFTSSVSVKKDLNDSKVFFVRIERIGDNLKIFLYLAT